MSLLSTAANNLQNTNPNAIGFVSGANDFLVLLETIKSPTASNSDKALAALS